MRLVEHCRYLVTQPNDPWHAWLRDQSTGDTIAQLAFHAGAIDTAQFTRLMDTDWAGDFSAYVGPLDTIVRSESQLREVPEGDLIALIHVGPPVHNGMGHRRFVHALVSLGGGYAAGNHLDMLALATDDRFRLVNLAEHLNWIPLTRTDGYDAINLVPRGTSLSMPIRLRHRSPTQLPKGAFPIPPPGYWGHPTPSTDLADRMVAAARASLQAFSIEPSGENRPGGSREHDPVYRPSFKFRIAPSDFEAFFNSPNELRGHYYESDTAGNTYTATLLKRLYDAVESIVPFTTAGQFFDDPVDAMRQSFYRGKIWTNESPNLIGEVEWTSDAALPGNRPIPFTGNRRWKMNDERNRRNWQAFLTESRLWSGDLPDAVKKSAHASFRNRFENTGYAAESGASYFYTRTEAAPPGSPSAAALARLPNIDVKGQWTRRSGADGDYTPAKKLFRGLQIKWFGFT